MAPVTNQMLAAKKEKDCTAITLERKYFENSKSFIKRSLRPSEWQLHPMTGAYVVPRFGMERILNEGAALQFIANNTNITVPKVYACFEDDQAAYLVTELIEGVQMATLGPEERKVVEAELEGYIKTLRRLKSSEWGGPTGIVVPPYRLMVKIFRQEWRMKPRESEDLVFCHNDFSAHNVIVDPTTLKVKAVIDWEYAGFFPEEFEGMFFRRPGPSTTLEGEENDEDKLLKILRDNEKGYGKKM
ncbi:hypothetical protein PT974_02253 [Cladobotryum mycophilum]|uniref:Aminoglycoside phosphotransferase domain-containing protein n=1 Tax=Cladobotryum mycophilum TaxID=491253 RepID=A0ABR0SYW0_9HYPO